MSVYRLLTQAKEDLQAGVAYYDSEFPSLGYEFALEVRRLCRLIAESLTAGFEVKPHIRRRILRRFPYSILYTVEDDTVVIIAIAHQGRRPEYWSRRVQDGGISGEYWIRNFSGESNAIQGHLPGVSRISPD
jgi:plasmid stabilization system protein ParE